MNSRPLIANKWLYNCCLKCLKTNWLLLNFFFQQRKISVGVSHINKLWRVCDSKIVLIRSLERLKQFVWARISLYNHMLHYTLPLALSQSFQVEDKKLLKQNFSIFIHLCIEVVSGFMTNRMEGVCYHITSHYKFDVNFLKKQLWKHCWSY